MSLIVRSNEAQLRAVFSMTQIFCFSFCSKSEIFDLIPVSEIAKTTCPESGNIMFGHLLVSRRHVRTLGVLRFYEERHFSIRRAFESC